MEPCKIKKIFRISPLKTPENIFKIAPYVFEIILYDDDSWEVSHGYGKSLFLKTENIFETLQYMYGPTIANYFKEQINDYLFKQELEACL